MPLAAKHKFGNMTILTLELTVTVNEALDKNAWNSYVRVYKLICLLCGVMWNCNLYVS